ncbi:MAG: hypothetical protein IT424_15285 [Pirellulales bacterium]|nr:hypothetical protein [Pirellulales bacterium]
MAAGKAIVLGGLVVAALALRAEAATITRAYQFADVAGPAFRWVSGDVAGEVIAEVSGGLVVAYDDATGVARLVSFAGELHSAQTAWMGAPHVYPAGHFTETVRDDVEGAAVGAYMAGLAAGLTGSSQAENVFSFGPGTTPDGAQRWRYTLTLGDATAVLTGETEFNATDNPSHFLNAALAAVPEPAGAALIGAALCVAAAGRRPCHRGGTAARGLV